MYTHAHSECACACMMHTPESARVVLGVIPLVQANLVFFLRQKLSLAQSLLMLLCCLATMLQQAAQFYLPVLGSEAWTIMLAFLCGSGERMKILVLAQQALPTEHFPRLPPYILFKDLWCWRSNKLSTICFLVFEGYILISLCGLADFKFVVFPQPPKCKDCIC